MPWQCLSFSLIPIFWLEEADLVQIWSLDLITGKKKKHEISTTSPFNTDVFYPQIEISRENNEVSFGLTLCNEISEDELGKTIVIETVVIDSPAYSVGVMAKDVLVAIDGKKIESLKQAAKLIKSKSRYLVPLISSFESELHITSGVFLANLNFRNFMKIFWRLGTFQLSLKPFLKFASDHLPFNHSGIITVTDSTCNSKPDCRCLSYKLWLNVNPELSVSVHQTGDIRLTMDSSKICRLLPLKTFVAERISGLAQEPQPRLHHSLPRLLKPSHPHGCCSYFIINFFFFLRSRFTATVQRPPTRISQRVDREKPENEQDEKTVVNFKNVALHNDSDSEDDFVNIVVPLFEVEDDEIAKSAMKEMLSRSNELRQRAEKKMEGR